MNDAILPGGPTEPGDEQVRLAQWLQQILYIAPREKSKTTLSGQGEHQL